MHQRCHPSGHDASEWIYSVAGAGMQSARSSGHAGGSGARTDGGSSGRKLSWKTRRNSCSSVDRVDPVFSRPWKHGPENSAWRSASPNRNGGGSRSADPVGGHLRDSPALSSQKTLCLAYGVSCFFDCFSFDPSSAADPDPFFS